jgi:hypothetical protein
MWIAMTSEDVSLALGSVRNVASPNVKVSRLLLLAGASPGENANKIIKMGDPLWLSGEAME